MRLLISGGGTGGHVYPALTVANAIQKRSAAAAAPAANAFLYLGRANSVEEKLATRGELEFLPIESGQVRGMAPWIVARNLWRMYASTRQVRAIIRQFKPDAIFVTGGYVSAPLIWAGAAERISSIIYLPDLEPGWAIKATARWATRIAVSFPEAARHFAKDKVQVTGYPVRPAFYQADKRAARDKFRLDQETRTIAIFGGSTGAHHINEAVVKNLCGLAKFAQVIHLTGFVDEAWVTSEAGKLPEELKSRVRVFGYLDEELPDALAAADLVVARAGAATLGEFPALGLPAILVPGPFAGKFQEPNARFLVERGAAIRIDDAELSRQLVPTITELFGAPEKLNNMRESMRSIANLDAASNLARLIEQVAKPSHDWAPL
jgi:UDP-N-acetylglucosamine--N-acetylmuramyl-(pentapeptide) pyrophosphoryl-undecaprenol N-acetylglucosamine transferase